VLLLVWLATSDEPEPPNQAVPSAQSPTVSNVEEQQADLTGIPAAPAEPHPLAAKVDPPGRTFIAKLNLQPRIVNGKVKGFVVRPDDPSILEGTPLQSGDVLLEVDGLPLDAARAALLAKDVGQYEDVFVRFERGSAEQEDMLPLSKR
jgi:type II secretory pathway component PulC